MNISIYIFVSLITITIPSTVIFLFIKYLSKQDLEKPEKKNKLTAYVLYSLIITVIVYSILLLTTGLLQQTYQWVSHITNSVILGAILFTVILITPLYIVAVIVITLFVQGVISILKSTQQSFSVYQILKQVTTIFAVTLLPTFVWLGIFLNLPQNIRNNPIVIILITAGLVLCLYALGPYTFLIKKCRKKLSPEEENDYLQFCRSLNIHIKGIRICQDKKSANAWVSGIIPNMKYIFITSHMIDSFEKNEIKAILAHEIGHIKGKHLLINALANILWSIIWITIAYLIYHFKLSLDTLFIGYIVASITYSVFIENYVSLWCEYKADEFAAKVVGKDIYIRTLNKLSQVNKISPRRPFILSLFYKHPSIENRIKHIQTIQTNERL